jgi:hypothetical protein
MKFGVDKLAVRAEIVGSSMSAVFSRLPLSWRGVGALIMGVLLARWTWILFTPDTLAVLPPKPDNTGNVAETLFGSSGGAATSDAELGNVHLVGVFSGKHGFAVLKTDEKTQRGVALGEDVIKGTKLVEVDVDHVVLEHNGVRQRVNLDNKSADKNIVSKDRSIPPPQSIPSAEEAAISWKQAHQEMQKRVESGVPVNSGATANPGIPH